MPEILGVLVRNAKAGDVAAARLLTDKVWPSLRPETVPVQAPGLDRGTLTERAEAAMSAVARGELAIDQATAAIAALAGIARVKELEVLESRLESIERTLQSRS